jgi:hypothetical protein
VSPNSFALELAESRYDGSRTTIGIFAEFQASNAVSVGAHSAGGGQAVAMGGSFAKFADWKEDQMIGSPRILHHKEDHYGKGYRY